MKRMNRAAYAGGMNGKRSARMLAVLFAAAFCVRFLLSVCVHRAPVVTIDESLYQELAKALAYGDGLAYRRQPINYPYLLYPLLLVPVYKLNALLGGDMFHYIQAFNNLLMASCIFPVYLFTKDYTGKSNKAFSAAVITALLPDMAMGSFSMSESVIWPMCLWLIFFAYRAYRDRSGKYICLTGLFTGLLYFAKPGAVTMGAALILVYIILCLRERKGAGSAFAALGIAAAVVAAMYVLYYLLLPDNFSLIGLYKKQTKGWTKRSILVILEALIGLPLMFAGACGGFFAVLPYFRRKELTAEQRTFLSAVTLGLIAVLAGTAVFVVPYQWDGSLTKIPLHMRYCAMYVPVFFSFSLATESRMTKTKPLIFVMLVYAVLLAFPGLRAGFAMDSSMVDSLALSAFSRSKRIDGGTATGAALTVMSIAFTLYMAFSAKKGWNDRTHTRAAAWFLAFTLVFNGICTYVTIGQDYEDTITEDAMEINEFLAENDEECLGVMQRYYTDIYSYWLEARLNVPLMQVTMDQMISMMEQVDPMAVYRPFTPIDQSPNVGCHETIDTTTFILGKTIGRHLELDENVKYRTTKHGHFTIVKINAGQPWVDTMFYGMDEDVLFTDKYGKIVFFDNSHVVNGEVHLSIDASGTGKLEVADQIVQLTEERTTYYLTIPYTGDIDVNAVDADAYVYGYSTDPSW